MSADTHTHTHTHIRQLMSQSWCPHREHSSIIIYVYIRTSNYYFSCSFFLSLFCYTHYYTLYIFICTFELIMYHVPYMYTKQNT